MNLSQLTYARTVAETNSFSRAAERCFVTQPSLSNAIAQLEEELGGRLFARTTHSVSLTPFGERMLPLMLTVLDAQAELERTARNLTDPEQKLLRVGFCPLVNLALLATVLEPFKEKNKGVEVVMKECLLDDLRERLANEKIDVLFVPTGFKMPKVGKTKFYSEDLCFLPRVDGSDSRFGQSVSVNQIGEEVFTITGEGCGLASTLREMFRASGHEFRQYPGQALCYSVLEDWASLGIGSAILPRSKVSRVSNARGLLLENGNVASITFEIVWNKRSVLASHVKELLRYFKKVVPGYVKGLTVS